ncbi:MAG: class I SAM-dependent methyltransferase [Reyranella sp.]|jgi:cyclopropane-fatty-acyl-phospholipid synthase|nr:class I SAM-dependent methyltransferase [Reyranella sp.]
MTIAARFVLKALERLSEGRLTVRLPDGSERRFGREGATPEATLHVRDPQFFRRVLADGDIGFAEAYMEGFCDSPDLPRLIALLAANEKALGRMAHANLFHDLMLRVMHWRRRNSRRGSRRNIHAHYDLGNDFYRLWLDPSMTYSAALYEGTTGKPLEAAQTAKYERILEQIGAKQGDSILEIGCGWGGFAETAAKRGMRVTGVTISRQQLDYARARLEGAGLADRVDLQFRDYRDMEGRYDHIVSIEMVEAVGERYWPDYFAALKRHVVPGGSILVQAIVIADEFFEGYRRHPDFIQTYVFPGGMLLSPATLREQCRLAGLKVAELYSFGRDYARTLETWLGRFDRVTDQVARMGFDERFRRMWRYYLAYCAAGFSTGRTDVLQAHFRHI